MRPLVLIANDDGIDSPYLRALADAIARDDVAEILVVAPERERSAASQSITLHKPLRITEVQPQRFAVSGSPVDSVYVGILKLAPRPPAVVVSGVNRGYNLGADVFYSGTVAAAVEGGLRGVPSLAISLEADPHSDIAHATRFATALIRSVLENPLPPKTIFNVNVPAGADGRYRFTRLGERTYEDVVEERRDPRGRPYYWIGGGIVASENQDGSDCHAVDHQMISVTPLHLDLTARQLLVDEQTWTVDGFEPVAVV